MKKWGLRILAALLMFTLGLCAVLVVRFLLAPAAKLRPVYDSVKIQEQNSPTQIAEKTQPTADDAGEVMKPHLVSISPYEIKRLVDENNKAGTGYYLDLEPVWQQLGIKKEDEINQCYDTCGAYINIIELDGKPGKETLLRLSTQVSDRYLIFKQIRTKDRISETWRLLGYIDAYSRWGDNTYRIATIGKQHWVVVPETTGHGSGFGSYSDTWYEVGENGVAWVLSYQTSLYEMAWETDPSISRETKVLETDFTDGITTIVLQSSTSYRSWKGNLLLWSNVRKATFVKLPGMRQFSFDPLHSEMIEKELDPSLGEGVFLTKVEFLKYNYRDLSKIANRGDTKKKDWLRDYLNTCDDSPEKQSLQKALEGARP